MFVITLRILEILLKPGGISETENAYPERSEESHEFSFGHFRYLRAIPKGDIVAHIESQRRHAFGKTLDVKGA